MKSRDKSHDSSDEFELWFTIGISDAAQKIVVLGVSRSKWQAQAAGLERSEGEEQCERWEVFKLDKNMGWKLRDWFMAGGMSREDAIDNARGLAESMKEKFAELREKHP
jgi:hypothetical protein